MISKRALASAFAMAPTSRRQASALFSTKIPRPAVSVCVQCQLQDETYYLLVQRGKEPNKGCWSLAGGKLEWGETAVEGGIRELEEETKWETEDWNQLQWYPNTVCTSDSIGEGYHYLIAQCFARLDRPDGCLPSLIAADDAADVDWWTLDRMKKDDNVIPGVISVVQRVEALSESGLLPTQRQS